MNYDIALIGAGVMGRALAQNIRNHGYQIGVYDIDKQKLSEFSNKTQIAAFESIEELTQKLKKPRKIIMMVNAGRPVDDCIDKLSVHLQKNDIIIDAGNSHFEDTVRRTEELEKTGIRYAGVGVSGGEKGALNGPSIMAGCTSETWNEIQEIFESIAAKSEQKSCCGWFGKGGAGHFVKMVHNGIEYGDMQLIGEIYQLLRAGLGIPISQIQRIFEKWKKGRLSSYLIEITADILSRYDEETGEPMVDVISDCTENKGTGKWTGQAALALSSPATVITGGVFARYLSSMTELRKQASAVFSENRFRFEGNLDEAVGMMEKALYFSKICSYAQGFDLLQRAAEEYGWDWNPILTANVWSGGCIIRAALLKEIAQSYEEQGKLTSIIFAPSIVEEMDREGIAYAVKLAADAGIPVPSISGALAWFDTLRCTELPASLLQAQRDYFGAHTYRRKDHEGIFHTEWQS